MWQKIVILFVYSLLVIVVLRSMEWYVSVMSLVAVPAAALVEPRELSVKKLKSILSYRGISLGGALEKKDLVDLVSESGQISKDEVREAETLDISVEDASASKRTALKSKEEQSGSSWIQNPRDIYSLWEMVERFTGASHFFEQVEDCRDTAWIIRVEVHGSLPAISEQMWMQLIRRFSIYDIRFGLFNCAVDPWLCDDKQWNTSRLLLAIPYAYVASNGVALKTYANSGGVTLWSDSQHQPIVSATSTRATKYVVGNWGHLERWMYQQMASKVRLLSSKTELTQWRDTSCLSDVCILLVSSLTLPPVLFSALAVRFTGRIKFGMANLRIVNSTLQAQDDDDENASRDESLNDTCEDSDQVSNPRGTRARLGQVAEERTITTSRGQYLVISPPFAHYLRKIRSTLGRFLGFSDISTPNPDSEEVATDLQRRRPQQEYNLATYGEIAGEQVSFLFMKFWLSLIVPDLNTMFLLTLGFVNILAVMSIFEVVQPLPPRIIGRSMLLWQFLVPIAKLFLILVKYNLAFFVAWALLLAFTRLPIADEIGRVAIGLAQQATLSYGGRRLFVQLTHLISDFYLCVVAGLIVFTGVVAHFKTVLRRYNLAGLSFFGFRRRRQQRPPHDQQRNIRWLITQWREANANGLADVGDFADINPEDLQRLTHGDEIFEPVPGWRTPQHHRIPRRRNPLSLFDWASSGGEATSDEADVGQQPHMVTPQEDMRVLSLIRQMEIGAHFLFLSPQTVPFNYILDLPVWFYEQDPCSVPSSTSLGADQMSSHDSESSNSVRGKSTDSDCAICLEPYVGGEEVCGLPCCHNYHRKCIVRWLLSDQAVCPVCRWPAYKQKEET